MSENPENARVSAEQEKWEIWGKKRKVVGKIVLHGNPPTFRQIVDSYFLELIFAVISLMVWAKFWEAFCSSSILRMEERTVE